MLIGSFLLREGSKNEHAKAACHYHPLVLQLFAIARARSKDDDLPRQRQSKEGIMTEPQVHYKIVWDFKVPAWGKKKKMLHMKGEMTGGFHPYTKSAADDLVEELNRTYGEGTHRVEELK